MAHHVPFPCHCLQRLSNEHCCCRQWWDVSFPVSAFQLGLEPLGRNSLFKRKKKEKKGA